MTTDSDYPLATLMELRERAKDDATEALAEALAEAERAAKRVDEAVEQLELARAKRVSECAAFDARVASGQAGIAQMRTFEHYRRRLVDEEAEKANEIERRKGAARQARALAEQGRRALEGAATELEAVVQHNAAWKAERALLVQRKEESAMDEVATRIWREQNQ